MGADLNYVSRESKKFMAMSDIKGGYYRDCYNEGGTFFGLGLSWWQDVIPMLDKENNLTPDKAKKLKEMVEDGLLCFEHKASPKMKIYNPQYAKEIIKDAKELIKYLDNAIKLDIKINCNL
jgi:hypothetical protein